MTLEELILQKIAEYRRRANDIMPTRYAGSFPSECAEADTYEKVADELEELLKEVGPLNEEL